MIELEVRIFVDKLREYFKKRILDGEFSAELICEGTILFITIDGEIFTFKDILGDMTQQNGLCIYAYNENIQKVLRDTYDSLKLK